VEIESGLPARFQTTNKVPVASLTRTRLASQKLTRPAATAIQPSQWKCDNCPDGSLVTIQPPRLEVTPIVRSRAQPLKLMNAPRREAGTASVMIACPGTNRPLANTKNAPPETNTAQTGIRPECVMNKITMEAMPTRPEKTRKLPRRSASLPISGAV